MIESNLFQLALGLESPWSVVDLLFSKDKKRLDIHIDFDKGGEFSCPECNDGGLKAYDSIQKSWRHLDFFQYEAHLHARVPRVQCSKGCGTKRVNVPWARPGSGFTLLFEGLLLAMCKEMPVNTVANLVGEHDTRLWRVLHHYIEEARANLDFSNVRHVGMDETSSKKGHKYMSIFCDMEEKKILFATGGKDKSTVEAFSKDLKDHQGDPLNITQACCDMSPSFISGVESQLPNAEITFDRFHLMKLLNEAVDQVRREEVVDQEELRGSRYIWLKNQDNLTANQHDTLESLCQSNLKTVRAYHIRLNYQDFFSQPDRNAGEDFLTKWYYWATHSKLEPIIKVAKTFKRHWEGILNWFDSQLTTGLLEGMNSLIQAAKSRARGYRTDRNIIAMSYLIGGKLNFDLPT